jgi:hypothetical protein
MEALRFVWQEKSSGKCVESPPNKRRKLLIFTEIRNSAAADGRGRVAGTFTGYGNF